jgi:ribosomal-protein-alanine N-acetyltransferase
MSLRPGRPSDLHDLEEIERSSFERGRFPRSLLAAMLGSDEFLTLVDEQHAVVGYVSVYLEGEGKARLVSIAVLPEWRGKGTARLLMERAEEASIERGASLMALEVGMRNVVALRLYLSQGFGIKGIIKDYYGKGKDAFYMEKELSSGVGSRTGYREEERSRLASLPDDGGG